MGKKKKWSKEKCRDRYIYGERITLRELSKECGLGMSTLAKLSKEDGWQYKREKEQNKIKTKTAEKFVEKFSDDRADELVKQAERHLKLAENMRNGSAIFIQSLIQTTAGTTSDPKTPKEIAEASQVKNFYSAWQKFTSSAIASVELERVISGAKYLDVNILQEQANRMGYELVEKQTD